MYRLSGQGVDEVAELLLQSREVAVEVVLGNELDCFGVVLLARNVFPVLLEVLQLETRLIFTVIHDYFDHFLASVKLALAIIG